MTQSFRHPEILAIARREGRVTVEDLARRFGVTLQTIRRDLTDLAEAGQLDRVHGGAVLPSGTVNLDYEDRRALNAPAKAAIGAAAAGRIADGSALFIGLGTTTEAVARALLPRRGLLVVTNNPTIAAILTPTDARVVLTGGTLRRADGGLVGSVAVETIRSFRFDIGITGCSALDPAGDVLDFDIEEVVVSRTILAQSRSAMLVADQTKLRRAAPARVADLTDFRTFVTDRPLPPALARRCREAGTDLVIVTD